MTTQKTPQRPDITDPDLRRLLNLEPLGAPSPSSNVVRPDITDNDLRDLLGIGPLPAPVSAGATPAAESTPAPVSAESQPAAQPPVPQGTRRNPIELSLFLQGIQDNGEPIVPPSGAARPPLEVGGGVLDIVASPFEALTNLVRQSGAGTVGSFLPFAFEQHRDPTFQLRPEAGLFEQLVEAERAEPISSQILAGAITDPTVAIPGGLARRAGLTTSGQLANAGRSRNALLGIRGLSDDVLRNTPRVERSLTPLSSPSGIAETAQYPPSSLTRPRSVEPPIQRGAVQSSMGIGEQAPQGQLFPESSTGATRQPLADADQLATEQVRREAIEQGQQEFQIPAREDITPLEQAQLDVDEARAILEAESAPGQRPPRFGTPERAEYDAARRQAASEGRRQMPKAQRVRQAREQLRAAEEALRVEENNFAQQQMAFKDSINFSTLREVGNRRFISESPRIAPNGEVLEEGLSGVLDQFRAFLQNPERGEEWRQTLLARSRARAERAASAQEIMNDLISKGVDPETAMRQSRQALAGELPTVQTPLHELATPAVRRALFEEVYTQLADDYYELQSTVDALTNALAGRAIPRTPGTTGQSAYSRLVRVFGDDLAKQLSDRRSLEEVIALQTRGNLGLTGFRGRTTPSIEYPPTQTFGAARQVGEQQVFGQVPTERLLPDIQALEKPQVPLRLEPPALFEPRPPDLRTQAQKDIDRQIFKELTGEATPPSGPIDPAARAAMDLPPDDVVRQVGMLSRAEKSAILEWAKIAGVNASDLGNFMRANLATLDLSYVRQQKFLIANHPVAFAQSFGDALRGLWSAKYARQIDDWITSDPAYALYSKHKLEFLRPLNPMDATAYQRAQEYIILGRVAPVNVNRLAQSRTARTLAKRPIARFANKLPWLHISERSFVTGTNSMNFRIWKGYIRALERERDQVAAGLIKLKPNEYFDLEEHAIKMGRHLENMTGRGRLPQSLQGLAAPANSLFFSLRLNIGRLFSFADMFSSDRFVRKEAMKNFFTAIATMQSFIMAGDMQGWWDTEYDPRSSDFMKIRVGNTRIDPWGGYQQYITLFARLLTGEYKSVTTGELEDIGILDSLVAFSRTKFAPMVSQALTLKEGRDFTGRKIDRTDWRFWAQRNTPILVQDTIEAYEEEGLPGIGLVPLSVLGEGIGIYEPTLQAIARDKYGKDYPKLSLAQKSIVRRELDRELNRRGLNK